MGTRKQINLRISGSRVLGRLKKSCKCCGNPDIYAIHLLPTAYPSKKLANSREKKKKKTNLKNTSQDLTAARRILRTHIPFVQEKKYQTNSKNSFSPSLCFLLLIFSYSNFFSFFKSSHQKTKNKGRGKKNFSNW